MTCCSGLPELDEQIRIRRSAIKKELCLVIDYLGSNLDVLDFSSKCNYEGVSGVPACNHSLLML